MKTILVVSYYFSPYNQIGSKRITSLSKFLLKSGYKLIVIKASNKLYGKNIELELTIKNKNLKLIEINSKNNFWGKYFLNYFKYKKNIKKIIKNYKISLVYFSGGPFYYFPIGKYIKKKFLIPYILDYRDNFFDKPKNIFEKIFLFIFKNIWDEPSLNRSSYIINVTPQITKLHSSKNKKINKNKFITILNGFDNKNIPILKPKKTINNNIINVGIFGKFYYYNPENLKTLINTIKHLNNTKIIIHQVGEKEPKFIQIVKNYKLNKNFIFKGYMEYSKGLKYLSKMDCLILNNSQKYALGTKIFDYIFLNKPIIAFINYKSQIDEFLKNFDNYYIVPNSTKNINFILEKIKMLPNKKLNNKNENIQQYSREFQFKKLLPYIQKTINDN